MSVPALEYYVVKVVLKGLLVLLLLLLLLQLVVRLGAGAATPFVRRVVSVVPLLLVLAVEVSGFAGGQLHPCKCWWNKGGGALEHPRGCSRGQVAPSIQTL